MLDGYERELPGLTEREAQHRRRMERMQLEHEAKLERRGQAFGFSCAVVSLAAIGMLFATGEAAIGLATLAALVGLAGLAVWSRLRG